MNKQDQRRYEKLRREVFRDVERATAKLNKALNLIEEATDILWFRTVNRLNEFKQEMEGRKK